VLIPPTLRSLDLIREKTLTLGYFTWLPVVNFNHVNATSLKEVTYTTSFSYNQDNTLKSITINSGASFEYYCDEKGLPNRASPP